MLTESTQEGLPLIVPAPRLGVRRYFAPLLLGVAACAAVIALLFGGLVTYGLSYGDNIYAGVNVAGIAVGGLSPAEAQARLDAWVQADAPSAVTLAAGERRWDIPLGELGATFDTGTSAAAAADHGHTGDLWRDTRVWLASLLGGHTVPLAVTMDATAIQSALARIAPEVARPAIDARYAFDEGGKLVVEPATAGVGVDVGATARLIARQLGSGAAEPIDVATVPVAPTIETSVLESRLKQARRMVSEPLILGLGDATWEISPDTLQRLLTVENGSSGAVGLRAEALAPYLASLADQVEQPGHDARVVWDGHAFVVQAGSPGQALDVNATVTEIGKRLAAGEHTAALQLGAAPPRIADDAARDAAAAANALVARPVELTWSGGRVPLDPAALAQAVVFTPQADQPGRLQVGFGDEALTATLQGLASQVEVAPKDADLRYYGGAVQVVSAERAGVTLDVAASVAAIRAGLESRAASIPLVTRGVEPKVTAAMAGSIVIRERLGGASSPYGDSVANRRHNVELAVERANGALIPPGGTYSFVQTVGDIDLDSGYRVGYGIVGTSNGSVSTVPSVGGGICQVSTTVFQAAFWAGMPIAQRSWHLYWIALYGIPPYGMTGLDATVDTDAGLDFKFKNTTDDWVAVVAGADGSWVTVELWGTDPGWSVEVDDPVVTNVVKADTEMQYQDSDQIAPGQQVYVERAQDGFDVAIHRQVTRDGEVVDDVTLRSTYRPSANVTLVGVE